MGALSKFNERITVLRLTIVNLFFIFIIGIIFFGCLIGGIVAFSDDIDIGRNAVLVLELDGTVVDSYQPELGFSSFLEGEDTNIYLLDLLNSIEAATSDDDVDSIFLDLSNFGGGSLAHLEEIRAELLKFQEAGKQIYSYAVNYDQGSFLLASFADKIFMDPFGSVQLKGFASQQIYFKQLSEKLGIKWNVFKAGKFKSAVEPYIRDNMSDEARSDLSAILNSFWEQYVNDISFSVTGEEILDYTNNLNAYLSLAAGDAGKIALEIKLVDEICTLKEAYYTLGFKDSLGIEDVRNLISYEDYSLKLKTEKKSKNQIAVIYLNGTITEGYSGDNIIGSNSIEDIVDEILLSDEIKAVVLRVNSGGGGSYASEVIRRSINELKAQDLPVVVSMGSAAASGAYWLSMASDYIFADNYTITGSIGAFGIFPTAKELLEEKIGLTFDGVKTAKFADSFSLVDNVTEDEAQLLDLSIEYIYDEFLDIVSRGRDIERSKVEGLAQGKIYTGSDALNLNLIDEISGFKAAINKAAVLSGIEEDFSISEIVETEDFRDLVFNSMVFDLNEIKVLNDLLSLKDIKNVYTYYPNINISY